MAHRRERAQPRESIEDGGTHLQLGDLAIEVTRHDAFAEQLEAAHFGFNKAASMIASPLLPDFPTKPAGSVQDGVTGLQRRDADFSMAWHSCGSE
jgi:hypothetical protein